jgi:hypothetical protein
VTHKIPVDIEVTAQVTFATEGKGALVRYLVTTLSDMELTPEVTEHKNFTSIEAGPWKVVLQSSPNTSGAVIRKGVCTIPKYELYYYTEYWECIGVVDSIRLVLAVVCSPVTFT